MVDPAPDTPPVRAGNWLLERALEALANREGTQVPATAYVTFAEPVWDASDPQAQGETDCASQLTVWVQRWYPYGPVFPTQQLTPARCGVPWLLVAQVQLVRCAPLPNEDGIVPRAVLEPVHATLMNDVWAMTNRIQCSMGGDAWDGIVGAADGGVQGDRISGQFLVTMDLDDT